MLSSYEADEGRVLYKFVKGLFDLAELIKIDQKYASFMAQITFDYCQLYLDLVCYYEPKKSVYTLKSLLHANTTTAITTTSNNNNTADSEYLRICRARNVWDGCAYLLERAGQVEDAFELYFERLGALVSDLQKSRDQHEPHESLESSRHLSHLKSHTLATIQLCQRNNHSLGDAAKEHMWLRLLNQFIISTPSSSSSLTDLSETLSTIVINGMIGNLSLVSMIEHILPAISSSSFRWLFVKILETCAYEHTLLDKTVHLVGDDVHAHLVAYRHLAAHSFAPLAVDCCFACFKTLDEAASDNDDDDEENAAAAAAAGGGGGGGLLIFRCGHCFHSSCAVRSPHMQSCPFCWRLATREDVHSAAAAGVSLNSALHGSSAGGGANGRRRRNRHSPQSQGGACVGKAQLLLSEMDQQDAELMRTLGFDDTSINSKLSPSSAHIVKKSSAANALNRINAPFLTNNNNNANNNAASASASDGLFKLNLSYVQVNALKTIRRRNHTTTPSKSSLSFHMAANTQQQHALKLNPTNITRFI